jgi:hypothetical protein
MVSKSIKDSDILKEARKHIEQDKYIVLCVAIRNSFRYCGVIERHAKLIAWIEKMLGPHFYYSHWLKANHPAFYHKQYRKWKMGGRCGSPWKEGRLAWLDWMIAECEREETQHG